MAGTGAGCALRTHFDHKKNAPHVEQTAAQVAHLADHDRPDPGQGSIRRDSVNASKLGTGCEVGTSRPQAEGTQVKPGSVKTTTNIATRHTAPKKSCARVRRLRITASFSSVISISLLSASSGRAAFVASLFSNLNQSVKNFLRTKVNFSEQSPLTH